MTSDRETYSHGHHESVLRSHRWRTAENSAGYLLPRLRPDAELLDVGIGPGTITVDLARRLPEGKVTGVDNAQEAVASAQRLAESQGAANLRLQVGDVYALDFPDAGFDVVHAHQVLQHLHDPVAALKEMRRVCRPDGVVAVRDADYAAMTWYPASAALTRWLEIYGTVARGNGGEPDAGRRLLSWGLEAGFGTVASSASAWCFSTPEDLAWWSSTWAERLRHSDFGRQSVAAGITDADELSSLADGWLAWVLEPGAWFTVLHGELLGTP